MALRWAARASLVTYGSSLPHHSLGTHPWRRGRRGSCLPMHSEPYRDACLSVVGLLGTQRGADWDVIRG
eukprot:8317158-Pyramimonas_sp.AAC.1